MNEDKFNKIREMLVGERTKTRKVFIYAGFFILFCAIILILMPTPQAQIPCYISPQQKEILKGRISSIASTQKVSEYTIFRYMKAALKYETIGKMPCDKYTEALEYLEDVERQVLN